MALSIREQIMQALAARLSAQRGLEGYDQRDLPLTVLYEAEESAEPAYGMTRITLPVTVARGLKRPATDWHAAATTALADLVVAIYGSDETLGGLAEGIDYTGGTIGTFADGADGIVVNAQIEIRFSHVRGNPYSQTEV